MKSAIPLLAAVFLGLWVLAGDGPSQTRHIDRSFDVNPGGMLLLESDLGSVDIKGHRKNTVEIQVEVKARTWSPSGAKKGSDHFHLSFEQDGNDVVVVGKKDRGWFWRNLRLTVQYHVKLPLSYHLKVRTAGGGIRVENVNGKVDVHTSGGNIALKSVEGPVEARTAGGGITLAGAEAKTALRTSGGSITASDVHGAVEARTSGGGIQLRNVRGRLAASTSGGSIQVHLEHQTAQTTELRTSGGSIHLSLPPEFEADLDARTTGGRVTCDLPVTISRAKHSELKGKLNGGGPLLSLRTSGGNIRLTAN